MADRRARPSPASHRAGNIVPVAINAVMLWGAHRVLGWGWFPWLTQAWEQVLPLLTASLVAAIVVNVGMWTERFVIVVESLHRDFLPSSWGMYYPTFWDWATLIGTLGLFAFLLFLFIRGLPMISAHEMRKLLSERPQQEARV